MTSMTFIKHLKFFGVDSIFETWLYLCRQEPRRYAPTLLVDRIKRTNSAGSDEPSA